ncbi:MAG: HAD family hydrolase [Chloroflexi bacterium]|nr:HAD family hydrolase [Chloroflexota bacterium]
MLLPKAFLFDLDNTVLAFDQAIERAWVRACWQAAPRLGRMPPEALREEVRRLQDRLWEQPEWNLKGRLDPLWAAKEIASAALERLHLGRLGIAGEIAERHVEALYGDCLAPLPGALEALERLQKRGVRLALVTNGGAEPQRRKINKFKLDALFDAMLIEGELGYGKPDARVFRLALERLGASPGDAWMVGDNLEHDVAPAQALGIAGVWVDWAGKGLPEGSAVRPDRVVRGLGELVR